MIIQIKDSRLATPKPPAFHYQRSESEGAFGPPACHLVGDSPDKNSVYDIARSLGLFTQVSDWNVYLLKCQKPGHWYIGHTNNISRRLATHVIGNGAWFTSAYGVDQPWSLFEVLTKHQAKFLELKTFSLLKAAYPKLCFSIGNACKCTNYSWEAHS